MVFFENDDGRVCIVFPISAGCWRARPTSASAGRAGCAASRRNATTSSTRSSGVFPGVAVSAGDVVYSATAASGRCPAATRNSPAASRAAHFVHRIDGAVPQFCMVGGKWTTFRAFAEQAADEVLAELGRARVEDTMAMADRRRGRLPRRCRLAGRRTDPRHSTSMRGGRLISSLPMARARRDVLAFCRSATDDLRLDDATEVTAAEIVFLDPARVCRSRRPVASAPDRAVDPGRRFDGARRASRRHTRRRAWRARANEARFDAKAFAQELEPISRRLARRRWIQRTRDRSVACA